MSGGVAKKYRECTEVDPCLHPHFIRSRRVVILTMEGLSNPEIAKELGVSVNTVKTIKLRAYRVLRERLKGIQWLLLLLLGV